MLHTCIPLALTLSVPAALPQEGSPLAVAPAADPLAALVPTDATIVVRIASYERFAQAFTTLDAAMAPEGGSVDPADAFGDLVPFMNASVRKDAPLLITFDALVDFGVTYVLPVDDVDAYVDHLVENFGVEGVERGDGYVGFNPARSYAAGNNPLVAELGDGTITAAIDLAAILEKYGPLVEMGIDSLRTELAPLEDELGFDVDALLDLYAGAFSAVEDSATVLRLGLGVEGDTLQFHGELGTATDSPLAAFATDTRATYGDNLYLDPGAPMHGVLGLDFEQSLEQHGDLIEDCFSIYPPEMQQAIRASYDGWKSLAPSIGDVGTFSLRSFGPDQALDAVLVYSLAPESEDLIEGYAEMLAETFGPEGAYERLEPVTAAGLEFARFRVDLASGLVDAGNAPPPYLAEMFDDTVLSVAQRDDALVIHMGGSEVDLADVAVTVSEPVVVGQAMARAFREIRAATPAMVVSMDMGAIVRAMDPGFADAELPESPVVTYAVVHDDRWSFGADLGITGMGALAEAARGASEQTLPLAEPRQDGD